MIFEPFHPRSRVLKCKMIGRLSYTAQTFNIVSLACYPTYSLQHNAFVDIKRCLIQRMRDDDLTGSAELKRDTKAKDTLLTVITYMLTQEKLMVIASASDIGIQGANPE
jgi:hypothetical protein